MKDSHILTIGVLISFIMHGVLGLYANAIEVKPKAQPPKKKQVKIDVTKQKLKQKLMQDQLKKILKKEEKKVEEEAKSAPTVKRVVDEQKPGADERIKEVDKETKKKVVKKKVKKKNKKKVVKKVTKKVAEKKVVDKKADVDVKPQVDQKLLENPPDAPKKALVLKNFSMSGSVEVEVGEKSSLGGDAEVTIKEQEASKIKYQEYLKAKENADAVKGTKTVVADEVEEVEVVEVAKPVIVPPKPLSDVKGKYPDAMKDYNRVVIVILKLYVSKAGKITKVQVINGHNKHFEKAARDAVKKLAFKPATKNGVAIAFPVIYKVNFLPEEI